jgi:hypothetical protein
MREQEEILFKRQKKVERMEKLSEKEKKKSPIKNKSRHEVYASSLAAKIGNEWGATERKPESTAQSSLS